jgi:hypothetical protein
MLDIVSMSKVQLDSLGAEDLREVVRSQSDVIYQLRDERDHFMLTVGEVRRLILRTMPFADNTGAPLGRSEAFDKIKTLVLGN